MQWSPGMRVRAGRGGPAGGRPHRQSALHWAVARPPKFDLTAEIRAHPDFRVKTTEKYVSLRSTYEEISILTQNI